MNALLGVTRPNFLTLTLVCIVVAAAAALEQRGSLVLLDLLAVTVLGLAAHVSVNAFNEYHDYQSGLDFKTQRTPFSGGSGTLVHAPHLASATLGIAVASLGLTIAAGVWLAWAHSWQLLGLGALGVAVIFSYTQYLNRSPLLCLLAPGVGFGLCLTLGASWVLSGGAQGIETALVSSHAGMEGGFVGSNVGSIGASTWLVAIVMTLLVSNLLLLNQFPDVEADRSIGRRHLPIVWGEARSARVFALIYVLTYGCIAGTVLVQLVTPWVLLSGVSLLLSVPLIRQVLRTPQQVSEKIHLLGMNVAVIHILPLLLAAGLLTSWWLGQSA